MSAPRKVVMVSTSYPRSGDDWQGLFIRKIAAAVASRNNLQLGIWAPDGPREDAIEYLCSEGDIAWLQKLTDAGGIAHRLRSSPLSGGLQAVSLLRRLRGLYRREMADTDLFHINWLQNAVPLYGLGAQAVVTVLGSDYQLLSLPGMVRLLRGVFQSNHCILAPNADWMVAGLRSRFGDVAEVRAVNFGIDRPWFEIEPAVTDPVSNWLCVIRVTEAKVGPLFEWGGQFFNNNRQLHLIGPNQGNLAIPRWVNYHGSLPASELLDTWYPKATGFITLSQHAEGKPQVLLETLAAGLPVIASDISAHREIIDPGKHGYLVNSQEEFGAALQRLSDPEVHGAMSMQCREDARRLYGSWDDCADRYCELYEELQ